MVLINSLVCNSQECQVCRFKQTLVFDSENVVRKIDHPLDSANKYLSQSSLQSPDIINFYNGNVVTDADGNAVVMPEWFEAVNRDFRYQLTVMGQFAQAIVASKIFGDKFAIRTDKPNVEVSWQVTGIRSDAWANAHPVQVEAQKSGSERGHYIHPELYGAPEESSIEWARHPQMMKELKQMRENRASQKPEDAIAPTPLAANARP
jgi:trimeric autotransporter adhesin